MTAREIIKKLNSQSMADQLGVNRPAIDKWRIRGIIPAIYWPAISRMPQAIREGITMEILERSGKKDRNA